MRRADKEVTDFYELVEIIRQCDVCRLALNDGDYPYILPLNFGLAVEEEQEEISFYFHGAAEGTKYNLLAKDNRASFELDCGHRLVSLEEQGYCTMEYASVIGRGRVEPVPEEEKYEALRLLMSHYHQEEFVFDQTAMPRTAVLRLKVEQMTGKRKQMPQRQ